MSNQDDVLLVLCINIRKDSQITRSLQQLNVKSKYNLKIKTLDHIL